MATPPTTKGLPLDDHIILFENASYHGAHKHVFAAEPNPERASDDNFFNDKVNRRFGDVFQGNWAFYRDAGLAPATKYPQFSAPSTSSLDLRRPGGYPFVP